MLGNESVVDFKTNIKLSLPKLFLIKFNDTNFKKIRKKWNTGSLLTTIDNDFNNK